MANKETKTVLKKGSANFQLIGKAKINDFSFDLNHEYNSGWTSNIMNLGVDCSNGNVVYAEMSGGYFPPKYKRDNVIYVHGVKTNENGQTVEDYDNSFTVDWEDRFNESILETIAKSCFITVGIEKDNKGKTFYKSFLAEYDAVQYLSEHLENDTVVIVNGKLTYESDGERTYIKKKINNIALSKANENDFKATFKQTILVVNDSIGKPDKEKNTIPMSVYVVDYVGNPKINGKKISIKRNFAFPVNMEFAIGENLDLTQKQLTKFFKTKKNEVTELTVVGNIVEGATIVNITDDDIPDDIKELIELDLYSEEEAKAKCAIGNNNREKRMIITKPAITYVGDDDNRIPTVAIDKNKYKPNDIELYSSYLAEITEDDDNTESTEYEEFSPDSDTDEDDELMALLNDLD